MLINRNTFFAVIAIIYAASFSTPAIASKPELTFGADGSFKIVQFTDIQDDEQMDPRTVAAMNKVLDAQKPDFVVITGDCIYSPDCNTADELKKAIDNIAQPMEQKKIPWAVAFGNHDKDNLPKLGVTEEQMLDLYMSYQHNLNKNSPKGVFGSSNSNLLVKGSKGTPAFGIWLLDSNGQATTTFGGQSSGYEWIHHSQINWYFETSKSVEKRWGKLPSVVFFHIPLNEFSDLANTGKITGEKNETPCPSGINSGLFAAVLERGDVKGIFAGHDHTCTFSGDWYGVKLGFGGSIGYAAYGLGGDDSNNNRLRGARVFTIDERNPAEFKTWYVTAAEPNKTN